MGVCQVLLAFYVRACACMRVLSRFCECFGVRVFVCLVKSVGVCEWVFVHARVRAFLLYALVFLCRCARACVRASALSQRQR